MLKEPYKVSILVPVYGVEQYIERCAVSLFEQTYQDLEFIFVDDCTLDKSIEILRHVVDKYPERKAHVQIISHENNYGIATTRNSALKVCNGDFFLFVDSDDWIENNAVEQLVKYQLEYDCDIITCNYTRYEISNTIQCKETLFPTTREMLRQVLEGKGKIAGLCGRLIRTSLVKNNRIHFVDGANFAEDVMMMSFLWFLAKTHIGIDECLYNYDHRNNSSYTNTFSVKKSLDSFRNLEETRNFFSVHAPEYLDAVNIQELGKVAGHMMLCSKDRSNKAYYNQELLKRLDSIDKKYWKKLSMKGRIALYLRNYELVRLYTKVGGFVKHFLDKWKGTRRFHLL